MDGSDFLIILIRLLSDQKYKISDKPSYHIDILCPNWHTYHTEIDSFPLESPPFLLLNKSESDGSGWPRPANDDTNDINYNTNIQYDDEASTTTIGDKSKFPIRDTKSFNSKLYETITIKLILCPLNYLILLFCLDTYVYFFLIISNRNIL
jgi:hypothetical protein